MTNSSVCLNANCLLVQFMAVLFGIKLQINPLGYQTTSTTQRSPDRRADMSNTLLKQLTIAAISESYTEPK